MKAELLDYMGDDLAVVNAARVSFDKESEYIGEFIQGKEGDLPTLHYVLQDKDIKLINYLAKHNHWTPFAHTAIKLRMSAPVPITIQCYKHKTGFVENGESRRYVDSEPDIFVPEFRTRPEGSIKQGSGDIHERNEHWKRQYNIATGMALDLYLKMINDGIAPEQARFVLPQGTMLNWIWTGSLAAYARFYNQRSDPHAQKEIQDLADMVDKIVRPLFPYSWGALVG